jgi:hypothetical protein
VIVSALAGGDAASATESASADKVKREATAGRFKLEMRNIRSSPDVKPVKGRSFVMHAVRYLGAVSRCNS